MSDSRPLGYDAVAKVKRMFHGGLDNGDTFAETATQDLQPYTDQNKELFNDAASGWGEGRRVAQIPNIIVEKLMRDGILSMSGEVVDPARFKAWLNDPDNRAFRTRPGRV